MAEAPELKAAIETERLLLRVPMLDDVAPLTRAINESHVELAEWMDWAINPQTDERSRDYCERSQKTFEAREDLPLLMVLPETGQIIGGTGLVRSDWSVPKTEIGYWCHSGHTGRGYVTEAAEALTRYALDELKCVRVELRMDDRNRRSWAVAERLGYTLEARLAKDARANDGSLRDTRIYVRFDTEGLAPG